MSIKQFLPFGLILILLLSKSIQAATIDTISTFSNAMNKSLNTVIILPNTYSEKSEYPVLYMLHGYGGNYTTWSNFNIVTTLVDNYNIVVVCPDGGKSWYMDSPLDSTIQYETYITKELIPYIDKNYKTIKTKESRAITGLSMGGYGALYLAFRNQMLFGAAGSMSGGVDLRPFPNSWDLPKLLGSQTLYPENWEKYSLVNLLHLLTPKSLKIIIDCGTEDFFYEVNLILHNKLQNRNIPHDYISRPGSHNAEYWDNAVRYQILYFNEYFSNTHNRN